MLRLDAGSLPLRVRDRGPGAAALGISLGLHGAAFAGLALFWEAKPAEPYAVIVVELVEAGGAMGRQGEDTAERSPSPISLERESAGAAGRMPDAEQLAESRDQDDRRDAIEASRRNGGSSGEKTSKPAQISAPAPAPENKSDGREATPPTPAEHPLTAMNTAALKAPTEAALRLPPTPRRKPSIQSSPAGPKSAGNRFERKRAEMKDEPFRSADQKSARDDTRSEAGRTAARMQPTATPNRAKKPVMAVLPAAARDSGIAGNRSESSGTFPRYSGGGLSNAAPRYPYLARRQGQEGRVVLRVQVSANGDPSSIRVRRSSGYRRLDDAAVRAVETWRFAPARRGGIAVAGSVDVPVSFKLTDR